MALSVIQFTVLFLGAFGQSVEDAGLELDTSGAEPVARKGEHVVSLLVINDRGIEWQVDRTSIGVPFRINGRDEAGDKAKADAHQKLVTALA